MTIKKAAPPDSAQPIDSAEALKYGMSADDVRLINKCLEDCIKETIDLAHAPYQQNRYQRRSSPTTWTAWKWPQNEEEFEDLFHAILGVTAVLVLFVGVSYYGIWRLTFPSIAAGVRDLRSPLPYRRQHSKDDSSWSTHNVTSAITSTVTITSTSISVVMSTITSTLAASSLASPTKVVPTSTPTRRLMPIFNNPNHITTAQRERVRDKFTFACFNNEYRSTHLIRSRIRYLKTYEDEEWRIKDEEPWGWEVSAYDELVRWCGDLGVPLPEV